MPFVVTRPSGPSDWSRFVRRTGLLEFWTNTYNYVYIILLFCAIRWYFQNLYVWGLKPTWHIILQLTLVSIKDWHYTKVKFNAWSRSGNNQTKHSDRKPVFTGKDKVSVTMKKIYFITTDCDSKVLINSTVH